MYSLSSGLSSLLLLLVLLVCLWLLEKDLGPCWDLDWTPSDIALLSFDTGIGRGRGKEETWRLEILFLVLRQNIDISHLTDQRLRQGLGSDQIHVGVDVDSVVGEDLLGRLEL